MNKDGGAKGFGVGGSALWPKQSNPAPIEANTPEYKKRVKQMKGAAKDALDIARAGAGYGEAEKELDGLVRDACSAVPVPKSEYRLRLLAWRDVAVVAGYEKGYMDGAISERTTQLGAKDE